MNENAREQRDTPIGVSNVEIREGSGRTRISGYAAVFFREGNDATEYAPKPAPSGFRTRERIKPGTFARALQENQEVVALFDHETHNLLGRTSAGTLELEEDDAGLRYTITTADTTIARDVVENIRAGNLQGSSFAFVARKETWEENEAGEAIRTLEDVDLYDVGPVVNPAYEGTSAEAAERGATRLQKARAKKRIVKVVL